MFTLPRLGQEAWLINWGEEVERAIIRHGGALHDLLQPYDDQTRGHLKNLRRPMSNRCIAATNMADVWNASEHIRSAKTLTQAKAAAKKFASSVRHI